MKLRVITYLWLALTLILLLKPGIGMEQPLIFIGEDKVVHFGLFVTLTLLWSRYLISHLGMLKVLGITFILAIGFGLSGITELLQNYIPGRQPDMEDFVMNIFGVATGMIFYVIFEKRKEYLAE